MELQPTSLQILHKPEESGMTSLKCVRGKTNCVCMGVLGTQCTAKPEFYS